MIIYYAEGFVCQCLKRVFRMLLDFHMEACESRTKDSISTMKTNFLNCYA